MTTLDEYLRPQEVAARLKCSSRLVYRMIADGTLPMIRVGRVVRVPLSLLEPWLDKRTHQASADDQAAA